jgi:hypothetical protein
LVLLWVRHVSNARSLFHGAGFVLLLYLHRLCHYLLCSNKLWVLYLGMCLFILHASFCVAWAVRGRTGWACTVSSAVAVQQYCTVVLFRASTEYIRRLRLIRVARAPPVLCPKKLSTCSTIFSVVSSGVGSLFRVVRGSGVSPSIQLPRLLLAVLFLLLAPKSSRPRLDVAPVISCRAGCFDRALGRACLE